MDHSNIKLLREKQRQGIASPEELDQLEFYADQLADQSQDPVFGSDFEKERIHDELRAGIALPQPQSSVSFWRVAAVFIALCGIAVTAWFSFGGLEEQTVIVSTDIGEVKHVVLPDGSTVTLNATSALEYPERFGAVRCVVLRGEALFSVTHDKKHPFEVEAQGVMTRVLGTTFNIKAHAEDSVSTVSLLEGSVSVLGLKEVDTLTPGLQSTYDLISKEKRIAAFDSQDVLAWKSGELRFVNITFKALKQEIRRNFGVNLRFADRAINDYTLSASFTEPDLETVLEVICATKGLTYHIEGDVVVISSQTH